MKEYLINKKYRHNVGNDSNFASKLDINSLIDKRDDEISKNIFEKIQFLEEKSNIIGSKDLIQIFNEIDNEKFDVITKLSDVKFKEYDESGELVLNINCVEDDPSDIFEAKGIYDFTPVFLESLFKLKSFKNFCFNKGLQDLASSCLNVCMNKFPDERRQFRFIKIDDELYIRGLTSQSYKNYDNHIVLYLTLCKMNDYSKLSRTNFFVEWANISDSDLLIVLKQMNHIKINENCDVKIGVRISNNEVREGGFSIKFLYTISDKQNNKFSAIGDDVMRITHSYKVERIEEEIENLDNIGTITAATLATIKTIETTERLDENRLYVIFDHILKNSKQSLSSSTKEKISLVKKRTANNVLSLIELFGKIESLTTDIDELLYLQKIFDDLLRAGLKR